VNWSIRLFIVDTKSVDPDKERTKTTEIGGDAGIREVFVNPKIVSLSHETWIDEEGCLSIPGLQGPVERSWTVTIEYSDITLQKRISNTFSGITARVIQHEYDHLEGILYLNHLSAIRRKLFRRKLDRIVKGKITAPYPMQK
jgi:peptide deformylase